MKRALPLVLLMFIACSKHEVEVQALRSNPFDADWSGPSFLALDSAVTVALVAGAVYQQRFYFSLDDRVTAVDDYSVRLIETTEPDTVFGVATGAPRGQVLLKNNQVQPGAEYCFVFDLLIEGNVATNHRRTECHIATP